MGLFKGKQIRFWERSANGNAGCDGDFKVYQQSNRAFSFFFFFFA